MNEATKQALFSAVRSLLIVAGSTLVARGYLSESTVNEIVGAVMVIAPIVWGIWGKFTAEDATKAREVVAVNVGIAVADRTAGVTPAVPAANVPAVIEAFAPVAPVADLAPPTGLNILPSTDPVVQPSKGPA